MDRQVAWTPYLITTDQIPPRAVAACGRSVHFGSEVRREGVEQGTSHSIPGGVNTEERKKAMWFATLGSLQRSPPDLKFGRRRCSSVVTARKEVPGV